MFNASSFFNRILASASLRVVGNRVGGIRASLWQSSHVENDLKAPEVWSVGWVDIRKVDFSDGFWTKGCFVFRIGMLVRVVSRTLGEFL